MSEQAAIEFIRLLEGLEPKWVLAISVGIILSYRFPLIVRELFCGIGGLLKKKRLSGGTVTRKRDDR